MFGRSCRQSFTQKKKEAVNKAGWRRYNSLDVIINVYEMAVAYFVDD